MPTRMILGLVLLGGCLGGGGAGGGSRPGVMPMLSELPGDPTKRDAILDQSGTTPGPEHRKPLPPKQRKAEITAATAAAILGGMFSKTQNVTLGTASTFDENVIVAPTPPPAPPPARPAPDGAPGPEAEGVAGRNDDLVPWIKLK